MDILISSNLERLIYHISGDDPKACAAFMKDLKEKGKYTVTEQMMQQLSDFVSGYADEEQTAREIRTVYMGDGYVIDPHTAVASSVYRRYLSETSDATPAVIDSTASPFKFEGSVMAALGKDTSLPDLELADKLSEVAGVPVPKAVSELKDALSSPAFASYPIGYWYNGTGDADTVGGANEHHPVFFKEALKELPDKFTNGVNAAMVVKKTSGHDYNAWLADFYNAMLVFYK
jgi:hypothetical protein